MSKVFRVGEQWAVTDYRSDRLIDVVKIARVSPNGRNITDTNGHEYGKDGSCKGCGRGEFWLGRLATPEDIAEADRMRRHARLARVVKIIASRKGEDFFRSLSPERLAIAADLFGVKFPSG